MYYDPMDDPIIYMAVKTAVFDALDELGLLDGLKRRRQWSATSKTPAGGDPETMGGSPGMTTGYGASLSGAPGGMMGGGALFGQMNARGHAWGPFDPSMGGNWGAMHPMAGLPPATYDTPFGHIDTGMGGGWAGTGIPAPFPREPGGGWAGGGWGPPPGRPRRRMRGPWRSGFSGGGWGGDGGWR